jgi:hypothetical protein
MEQLNKNKDKEGVFTLEVGSATAMRRFSVLYPGLISNKIVEKYDLFGEAPKRIKVKYNKDLNQFVEEK